MYAVAARYSDLAGVLEVGIISALYIQRKWNCKDSWGDEVFIEINN